MSKELMELGTSHAAPPVEHGSDRSFGIVFAIVFLVIGVLPIFTHRDVRVWALSLSGIFLLIAAVRPRLLNTLNRVWAHFGMLLNRIVSPVTLMVVYSVAVVPTALVLRLLRKDLLRLRTNTQVSSYWIRRTPPMRPDAQMKQQF